MRDLYSNLFYKIRFSIEEVNSEKDLLWDLLLHIKDWLTRKYNREGKINLSTDNHDWTVLKNGGQIIGENIRIFSEYCAVDNPFPASFWACKIIESPMPVTGMAPREWTTEIGFEPVDSRKATFSCIISYRDRPGFVGECEEAPNPSVPNLIKGLWSDAGLICTNGIDKPSVLPQKLSVGDWPTFWERLTNPEREMPYVYISHQCDDLSDPFSRINPSEVATVLGGNAIVYFADCNDVSAEMDYFCPEEYKCYEGAIRVYYPDIDISTPHDSKRHRFISSSAIKQKGGQHIVQILRRAIAQDAHFYENLFRIDDCRAKREKIIREKRLEELKKCHCEELEKKEKHFSAGLKQVEEQALALAEEAEKKQLEAEDLAAHFDKENRALKEEVYNLRSEHDAYYSLSQENASLKKACNSRFAIKQYPQSTLDIVRYFEATFEDKMAFSDDAIKSLKSCTIPADTLWDVFFNLATIMGDLYINGSGDIFNEFHNKTGINARRGEGPETRKDAKLMRQYETEYHGETIDIEAHITYSHKSQSIHFGFSEKDQKIIVGWCGEHKDNYTTRKVH